jgi:hypothetical protein
VLVAVGVPVIAPVEEEIFKPVGKAGETLYDIVPVPFEPVTGVKAVAAWFCVRPAETTDCVAVTAAFTVRLKVAAAVALLASVTVTVYVVAVLVAVGVPVIAPVDVERLKPVGKLGVTL